MLLQIIARMLLLWHYYMAKVNPKILEDQLREEGMYDSVWGDYISTMAQGDWTDWTEHP